MTLFRKNLKLYKIKIRNLRTSKNKKLYRSLMNKFKEMNRKFRKRKKKTLIRCKKLIGSRMIAILQDFILNMSIKVRILNLIV